MSSEEVKFEVFNAPICDACIWCESALKAPHRVSVPYLRPYGPTKVAGSNLQKNSGHGGGSCMRCACPDLASCEGQKRRIITPPACGIVDFSGPRASFDAVQVPQPEWLSLGEIIESYQHH